MIMDFLYGGSQAINIYLASKYGKDDSLYPEDLQKRAIVNQMLLFSEDLFYLGREVLGALLNSQIQPSPEMMKKVTDAQENVEKLLLGRDFIAGDVLTVADFSFITIMDLYELLSPPENKYPLTKTWFKRCQSTMKDFDKVNKKGADILHSRIVEALAT
uniref:GST C-terminal domain-containing protein n=2 Tax=Graphocephala atropunctata TaxID=36148 RepID=A0A1B6MIH8_9HEMI